MHIYCVCRAGFVVKISSVFAPLLSVFGLDFAAALVTLVTADNHFAAGHVYAVALHFFFPVHERGKGVAVVNIIHHDQSVSVLIELSADHFVLFIARQIEEVYADRVVFDVELLHTVVNADR